MWGPERKEGDLWVDWKGRASGATSFGLEDGTAGGIGEDLLLLTRAGLHSGGGVVQGVHAGGHFQIVAQDLLERLV